MQAAIGLTLSLALVFSPAGSVYAQAPTVFKKLDFYTQVGEEMDDHDAQLIIDAGRRSFIFAEEDHAERVFATVPWDRITGVTYENSKHARITAGLLIAWPMLFMSGKKHWLTITFGPDANGAAGGYVFARMDKDNFQTILAAINGFTGSEIRRVEESGEISVLYPGATPTPSSGAVAHGAVAASSTPAARDDGASSVDAAALPPRSDAIPAGALPPPADIRLEPVTLVNKGVQWTERSATTVGYVWGAEVSNPNGVAVDASVVLRLLATDRSVLHEVTRQVSVPAAQTASFTAEGEVPEAEAVRADTWTFALENLSGPEPGTGQPNDASEPSWASPADASGPTSPMIEAVPLTEDMTPPELVRDSVIITTDNPTLRQITLAGVQITIRCLVRADGSVADARVFRISPEVASDATSEGLKEVIRNSAIGHWRFSPARKDNAAVPVWHMMTIEYQPREPF